MSDFLYVVGLMTAKPGRIDDLKNILEKLAEGTRQEAGSVEYFFFHDETGDGNTIVSYEKWKDAAAEAAHWETPHIKQALADLGDILETPPVVHKGPQVI